MYENFYQLRAKPFRLSPDPSFFFASRGHKRALAYLRYGLSQAEGFVVITGAPGTGKTTLAQILLQEMDQSDVVVAHLTTTQLEADEMLRMVMASFGLRYEGQDKAALLKTLEAFFMARSRENKRVLLVVDEAQNLPARSLEELRMLSNLQVGERALLQTFLLGQVQFRQMLDHPDLEQLRQRVIANYHLSALGEDECQSYIESRLAHVGWNSDPDFTDEAFGIIYKYTEGVPRRINMLCDRVLLFSSLEEQHTINADVLQDVTDELQSEISGKPIARPTGSKAAGAHEHVPVINTPEPISEMAPPEPVFAKETQDDVPEADEVKEETKTDTFSEPVVSEPVIPEPLVAEHTEDHAAAISFPDDGGMDRAVPDDGWMQHVAQAQPDYIETDEEHGEHNNEPAEMERFRVIAGGKEASKNATVASRPANQHSPNVMAPLPDAPGDSQEVVLRKILRLVLAFHRSPRSFPGLDDPTQPLPNGIKAILELAIADDQVLVGLRQIAIMGISPSMLRAAVRFFVRRVLFLVGGDDFRVLGLATNSSLRDVEAHYGLLMKLLRQDKKANDESGVLRVGEAYERLCRSEITSRPRESIEIYDSVDNVSDIEEELDLDLSPNVGLSANAGMRPAPTSAPVNDGAFVASEARTAPMARNLMLVAGAAVIVFVLYLTQIKTTEDVVPALAVDSPSGSIVATEPVSKPEVVSEVASIATPLAPADKTISEGVAPTEFVQSSQALTEDLLAEKIAAEEALKVIAAAEAEEQAKIAAANEAAALAEAKTKAEQDAQAKAEATLRAAAIAKRQLEVEILARLEAQAREKERVSAEARRKAEANAKIKAEQEAQAKAKAQAAAKIKAEAAAKAEAETKARVLAAAKVKAETQAKEAAKIKVQVAKSKTKLAAKTPIATITKPAEVRASVATRAGLVAATTGVKKASLSGIEAASKPKLKTPVKADTNKKVAAAAGVISAASLNKVLSSLEVAYQSGDLSQLTQLFSPMIRTNDQTDLAGVRDDYQSLFNNTVERRITFSSMNWKREENYARGAGQYAVSVLRKGETVAYKETGKITLQLEKRAGKLHITRFYTSAPVVVKSAKSDKSPSAAVSAAPLGPVSAKELDASLRLLANAYSAGDIDAFMQLFAKDAQTNDQSTVKGIREDYLSLFNNTAYRSIVFKNMQWAWDKGIVRGNGTYDVEVQAKGNSKRNRYQGQVWIQMERRSKDVRITHFAIAE